MAFKWRLAGGAAALTVASLPFATDIPGAGADSFYEDRDGAQLHYQGPNGETVHCSVTGHSALMAADGDYQARSESGAFANTPGEDCRASFLLEVTYIDTAGSRRTTYTEGTGTTVAQWSFDIRSGYEATHTITLLECRPSATSACSATFSTQPK
jgi:hypothetical protein